MAKYNGIENIGEVLAEELFATVEDENIKSNELFYRKVVKKLNEAYMLAINESMAELKEAMDAIESLK